MKRCSRCREEKPLSEFTRRADSPDGRYYYCRECRSALYQEERDRCAAIGAAANAALGTLRERHRAEYDALYDAELERRGVVRRWVKRSA